ncbi:hypothetical protein SAY86_016597 [Trapa natans]|uniref:Uncharacterized protein n=1 Tax=Trapa natans TaxID=22666 RepID=A0AAN7R012_TRANT|nr:hypothetical protein SAY86_016597 [Trapa natans]
MADLSHLEKMGRELKCPICLSLLSSAATLACNHVFCNACIMKYMKSGSTCPVCKVPYCRREIRAAPHMDNLVNIYKNMEAALGVNIFATQAEEPTKLSDAENNSKEVSPEGTSMPKRSLRRKMSTKANNASPHNSSPILVKPSCPTKKRVQVPQRLSMHTHKHSVNPDNVSRENKTGEPKSIPAESMEKSPIYGNGEPVLFSWLRDEVAETSSQESDIYLSANSPVNIPTFSDLKCSDDEMPTPSTKEINEASAVSKFFDNDMLELTQRSCSPELCSSPLILQDSNNKDLETDQKDLVSAEGGNKRKKRQRGTRVKFQQELVKRDIVQSKASKICQRGRANSAKKCASGREKGVSSGILTKMNCQNNSGILDRSAKNYDASDSAKWAGSKKVFEVSGLLEKDSSAASKKRKVDSALMKSESNARKKKFLPGSNCNLEPTLRKTHACPSDVLDAELVLHKSKTISPKFQCAFCQSSECSEASGEMVHYHDGIPVSADYSGSGVIHSHRNCVEWAPNVYFEDEKAINLEAELARSKRIRCSCCGIKGAALGCFEKSCRKSFHVTCAKMTPECQWDNVNYVMLCPLHVTSKLPTEATNTSIKEKKPRDGYDHVIKSNETESGFKWKFNGPRNKMVLCCSTLTATERDMVSKFEKSSRVTVLHKWDSRVTHIIASTDENGACRRTLKVLMGILQGKWILSIEWIKACLEAMDRVDEEKYEILVDVHGMRDGPRLGRLRVLNMQPKLFEGLKFYLTGDFISSYRGYLQDLVIAAGGTILHRKPVSGDEDESESSTFIVYSLEVADMPSSCKDTILKQRKSDAEALAASGHAKVVSNSWILNSIAASKLQISER